MTSVFFSDDDPGFAGINAEFQAAFDADFNEAVKEAEDRHFRAHCEEALKDDPNNPLLREAIQIDLLLRVTE